MYDAFGVGHICFGPFDNGIGIVLEHLFSVVVVEHDSSTKIGTLVISRRPVVVGVLADIIAVPYLTCWLTIRHLKKCRTLCYISLSCFLIVTGICLSNGEIAGTYGSRAVNTRICTCATVVLPLQQVVPIAVSTLEHSIEVFLRCGKVFPGSCKEICTNTGNAHPGNVIIIFIVTADTLLIPSVFVAVNEVDVKVLKHCGILLVACCLESI